MIQSIGRAISYIFLIVSVNLSDVICNLQLNLVEMTLLRTIFQYTVTIWDNFTIERGKAASVLVTLPIDI